MSRYTMGPCKYCGSSDAFASYEDGVGHCFSCSKSVKLEGSQDEDPPAAPSGVLGVYESNNMITINEISGL